MSKTIKLTESEMVSLIKRIINEQYDSEKLYSRAYIVDRLYGAPRELRRYIKNLPHIDCTDNKGNKQVFSESSRREPDPAPVKKPQAKPQINEVRKKLADSIGKGAYASVFEGLEPAPSPNSMGGDDGDAGMDLSILNNIPGLKGFK